jgi:hypothetical protein
MRRSLQTLMLVGAMLLLSSCAAGPNPGVGAGPDSAGFWMGLWHGLIAPVTFIISLFTEQVNVYEVTNNGNWYDFGFILGVATSLGGGGGASAGTRRRMKTA